MIPIMALPMTATNGMTSWAVDIHRVGCFLSNVDVGIFPTKSFLGDVGSFPTKLRDDCFLSKCYVVLFPNFFIKCLPISDNFFTCWNIVYNLFSENGNAL